MTELNKVIMVGRLTKNPESRDIGGDTTVCNLSIAFNDGFGEKQKSGFVEVTCWNKTAKFVQDYFNKGKEILIEGRLGFDSWEDKDTGAKRSKVYITADRVGFVGSKSDQNDDLPPSKPQLVTNIDDDDIPF